MLGFLAPRTRQECQGFLAHGKSSEARSVAHTILGVVKPQPRSDAQHHVAHARTGNQNLASLLAATSIGKTLILLNAQGRCLPSGPVSSRPVPSNPVPSRRVQDHFIDSFIDPLRPARPRPVPLPPPVQARSASSTSR